MCLLLLAVLGHLLVPLLPRVPEGLRHVHVVRLFLVLIGFLMIPEVTMDVGVEVPVLLLLLLLLAVLVDAAPQDVRLVVVHSCRGPKKNKKKTVTGSAT